MALVNIPNQPIHFDPYTPDECNVGDGKQYCALFNAGDTLYTQFKQTPCDSAEELVCDPTFSDLEGPIVNPTFSGSLTGWTNSGGWYYDDNKASINGNNGEELEQNTTLSVGSNYTLQFTVSNYQGGSIDIEYAGSVENVVITGDGTYTASLTGGSDTILIIRSQSFFGSIDTIIVTNGLYTSDCYTAGENWLMLPDIGALHSAGSTESLEVTFTEVLNTGYQRVQIVLTDVTAGYLRVYDGTDYYDQMTSNGTYNFYVQSSGTVELVPSNNFVGTVVSVSIRELRNDFDVYIEDLDTRILTNINPSVSYHNEYVTISHNTTGLSGCYRLAVFDPCGENVNDELVVNGTFQSGVNQWTDENAGFIDITNGLVTFTAGSGDNEILYATNQVAANFDDACTYELAITFGEVGANFAADNSFGVNVQFGNVELSSRWDFTPVTGQTFRRVLEPLGGSNFEFQLFSLVALDTLEITEISIKKLGSCGSETGVNNYSNCFNVATTQDCAKLVQAYTSTTAHRNGFYHHGNGTAFRLSSRYRLLKFNPFYPTEAEDFEYSNGSRKLIYSSREKYWEALFDYIDEDALDAITAMMLSEVFTIDGQRYYVKPEDFKPEWAKEGTQRLAQLRVELRKIDSTIYNGKK